MTIDPGVGSTEFGPVAEVYDELMRNVPYRMWVGYYLLLLSKQGVKPRSILDVCCGTGAVTELLHEEGFEMEGFDLSGPMIEMARSKAALGERDIRYEVFDAATFEMGRAYDGAFSFFDSLNYIVEPESLQKTFFQVAKHLQPGGSWVFDLNTAYAFEHRMFDQRKLSPRSKVRYEWTGEYDKASRIIQVRMDFWAGERHFSETHIQRAHEMWEVRQMLINAGFEDIDVYHSYSLDPPRAKSDRIHFACRKRGAAP